MGPTELFQRWLGRTAGRRDQSPLRQKPRARPNLETLEDRTLPSSYTAGTVAELIAAINAANQSPEADSIALVSGRTFTLTEINNPAHSGTGLPTISANGGNLTILGNRNTIERSTATGTPAFRLFEVAAGASLSLETLTLQGGLASGSSAVGGAILNLGALTLLNVTVQNNIAQGTANSSLAAGGGIYSSDSLTVQGGRIQNNQALGYFNASGGFAFGGGLYVGGTASLTDVVVSSNTARGGDGSAGGSGGPEPPGAGAPGGDALGGGLYVAGSYPYTTVSLTRVTLSSNTATGGDGGAKRTGYKAGDGGNGLGGGLYADGYTRVTLRDCIVSTNSARGGAAGKGGGGNRGLGIGGGIFIYSDLGALVCLDAFTVSNVKGNKAATSDPNIAGSYTICS